MRARPPAGRFCPGGGRAQRARPGRDRFGVVDQIKQKTAQLIDLCEGLKAKDARLAALAQTYYEIAGMLGVKAATADKP
jgi:hypothetical protein